MRRSLLWSVSGYGTSLGAFGVNFKGLSYVLVLLALLSAAAHARASGIETYTYLFRGKTTAVPVGEIEGVRVNDVCFKNAMTCQAMRAFHDKQPVVPSKSTDGAGDHCKQAGGRPLLLTTPKYGGALFCVFQDLTMVDARAMFSAHWRNR